jgi:probable rRNA maturation factor
MTAPLTVDVTVETAEWEALLPDAAALAEESATAAWRAAAPPSAGPAELSVLLADDAAVQRLNKAHRGQDKPTNVLSFPIGDTILPDGMPAMLGDVVLASGVVSREARTQGKTVMAHFRHLIVHGVLHLVGYDHVTDRDAETMEALEIDILGGLAVPDPYGFEKAANEDASPRQRR